MLLRVQIYDTSGVFNMVYSFGPFARTMMTSTTDGSDVATSCQWMSYPGKFKKLVAPTPKKMDSYSVRGQVLCKYVYIYSWSFFFFVGGGWILVDERSGLLDMNKRMFLRWRAAVWLKPKFLQSGSYEQLRFGYSLQKLGVTCYSGRKCVD